MIWQSLPLWEVAVRIVRKKDLSGDYHLKTFEELFYRLAKILENVFWWLDKKIPLFPSWLKTIIWKQSTIFIFIATFIFTFGLCLFLLSKKRLIKLVVLIFVLWLIIPFQGLTQISKSWLFDKTGLDYKIARSSQTVWIWPKEKTSDPFTLFQYKWYQNKPTKSAQILVSNLGYYRLIVNDQAVYSGPNFASGQKVYYDQVDISSYILTGQNNIEIIANFTDEEMHAYQTYLRPAILVGGWVKDGLSYHNLTDSQKWQAGSIKNIQNDNRVSADAGYEVKADFSQANFNVDLSDVARLKTIDYIKLKNPLPNLLKNEVNLIKDGNRYDLGRFSTGYIEIKKQAGSSCHLQLSWWVEDDDSPYFNQSDKYFLPEGDFVWTGLNRRSGRYIKVEGDCKDTVEIHFWRISADLISPSLDNKLSGLDAQIYNICQNTIENNVQNKIEDCVDREKAMYVGDARQVSRCLMVEGQNQYYVKQMILKLADAQRDNGAIPALAPSGQDMLIPGYSLQWLVWLSDYYKQTNDKSFLKELTPTLDKLMEWVNKNENPQGYFERQELDQWWNFTDWTPLAENLEFSTALQIWYYQALKSAGQLYQTIDKQKSKLYIDKADQLRVNLRQFAFDKDKGIFVDSFDQKEKSVGTLVVNSLAAISDLFDSQKQALKAFNYFKENGGLFTDSPYSQSWVVEWMIIFGQKEEAKKIIRQYWGAMIQKGATSVWEIFNPINLDKKIESRSHAWGCGPIYLYDMIEK